MNNEAQLRSSQLQSEAATEAQTTLDDNEVSAPKAEP